MHPRAERLIETFWRIILIAHFAVAGAWWWLMPGGFPVSNGHFWLNRILPLVVIVAVIIARFRAPVRMPVIIAIACAWLAAGVSARLHFPITFHWLWLLPLLTSICMLSIWLWQYRMSALRRIGNVSAIIVGSVLGAVSPLMLGPLPPATIPSGAIAAAPTTTSQTTAKFEVPGVQVNASQGFVTLNARQISIGIQPLLTFDSRSPDGCLVLLAREDDRTGPERQLVQTESANKHLTLNYTDDGQTRLEVDATDAPDAVQLTATSSLPKTIWSHLNTFTELTIVGHKRLFVSFSPCPDDRIEVKPMDYPVGAPSRFGYLGADGVFRVVEARSAEKGPFRELAGGKLNRGEPLTITFYDHDAAVAAITFDDWAAQASTQLSPTGGWGVPENAIEFSLQGKEPGSMASVFITLGATSVGRGYDAVGHAPGTYRNRLRVQWLTQ